MCRYAVRPRLLSAGASLSVSLCPRVCVWICVDPYDVLGSGAMADPCWLACALGVIWCVVCAWVAVVVLVGASVCECLRLVTRERERACLCLCASFSLFVCVCVWICVDVYGVLGSGAMADPCWLACALGMIWCVLCAWVAAVVLAVGLRL